jgi:hypothetical protein
VFPSAAALFQDCGKKSLNKFQPEIHTVAARGRSVADHGQSILGLAGAGFNWAPSATSVDAALEAGAPAIGGRVLNPEQADGLGAGRPDQ